MLYLDIMTEMTHHRMNKDKDMSKFYSFVIGEIQKDACVVEDGQKTYPDEKVISSLKSLHRKLVETKNEVEINEVAKWLPKQLSENEITDILISIMTEKSNVGKLMKHMKDNYHGQYDGKLASSIAKEILSDGETGK